MIGLGRLGLRLQVRLGPDDGLVTVETGITVTAARTTSRGIRRHKASNSG
jgi:hypothetical protein